MLKGENMDNQTSYNEIVNTLVSIEDRALEASSVVKVLDIWAKERDFEMIPIVNILNEKIQGILDIIKK